MARLWAKTVTFQAVSVGDRLPVLIKWHTAESMKRLNAQVSPTGEGEEEDCQELLLHLRVLTSYVTELLQKAFPVDSITAPGSKLEVEPLAPVRPEDTISLSGRVVGKGEEQGRRLVECEIVIENQGSETVGRGMAVVSLVAST
jgi:hypothetical protein